MSAMPDAPSSPRAPEQRMHAAGPVGRRGFEALAMGGVALALAFGLLRGLSGTAAVSFGWYDGYGEASNAWRVAKSAVYALLLVPLLRRDCREAAAQVSRYVVRGMLTGVGVLTCAVIWERAV